MSATRCCTDTFASTATDADAESYLKEKSGGKKVKNRQLTNPNKTSCKNFRGFEARDQKPQHFKTSDLI